MANRNQIHLDEIIATPDKRYNSFINSLPPNQRYSKDYNTYRYWQLYGKPNDFSEALKLGMYNLDDDGSYHANSVAYNPYTGEYEFMKSSKHESLQKELDWYYGNTQDAIDFRKNYDLDTSGEYYKYIPRQSMKLGGNMKRSLKNIGISVSK